jgi:hypothetical protein
MSSVRYLGALSNERTTFDEFTELDGSLYILLLGQLTIV